MEGRRWKDRKRKDRKRIVEGCLGYEEEEDKAA